MTDRMSDDRLAEVRVWVERLMLAGEAYQPAEALYDALTAERKALTAYQALGTPEDFQRLWAEHHKVSIYLSDRLGACGDMNRAYLSNAHDAVDRVVQSGGRE